MTMAWAIIETNYDYDDNRYNESGFHPAREVYISREAAEAECLRRNLSFYRDRMLDNYAYDADDAISKKGQDMLLALAPMITVHMEESIDTDFETSDTLSFYQVSELFQAMANHASPEAWKEIYDEVRVRPFSIVEVELIP